jgi:UDP-GlcNAc3NAcA epimerase
MTGKMLIDIEKLLYDRSPACVLVYGDTTSTLAGALAAAKLGIPIAHVEAGLRSGLKTQPEEINRVITDQLSRLLFCPTRKSVINLKKEGITEGVFHVGDVMYDVAQFVGSSISDSKVLKHLKVESKKYCLATIHRAENTDNRKQLLSIIEYLKNNTDGQTVLMPLHPRTREAIENFDLDLGGIITRDPVSYVDMASLIFHAITVFTDSGGLQKEAYFHGVPCVTLRNQTEWTELVDAGWNRLWTEPEYKPRKPINDYGSGHASQIIVNKLVETFT